MKKHLDKSFFIFFCLYFIMNQYAVAQYTEADILRYIDTYKDVAMDKMVKYKIPASITLAQGIFESACGMSKLATEGNNHFGIKCHKDWSGDTIHIDDDELQECFRKYEKVEDSYNDHSLFLTNRKRYQSLFSLNVMDYEAWAKGLKAAGYATNPEYAPRLVNLINTYQLARFDTLAMGGKLSESVVEETQSQQKQQPEAKQEAVLPKVGNVLMKAEKMKSEKEVVEKQAESAPAPVQEVVKQEPTVVEEQPVQVGGAGIAVFTAQPSDYPKAYCPWTSRVVYENNRTQFVIAAEGDTYAKIAKEVERSEKDILKYNEAFPGSKLVAGQVVYIEQKSKRSEAVHVVQKGETLRLISQKYAVQLSMIYFYNNLSEESVIKPDDKILLSN